jgi:primary-amine oxidase
MRAGEQPERRPHPLDPLSGAEIASAVAALRAAGRLSPDARVIDVSLREPAKERMTQPGRYGEADAPVAREAAAVLLEPAAGATYEAVVSLDDGAVTGWREVPGACPPVTLEEYAACERLVRRDPAFRAGLARRGITHPDRVLVEAWGLGAFGRPEDAGRRLAWTLCFERAAPDGPDALNPYARPVEGLHAIVDLNAMTVVRVEDHGIVPVPPGTGAYTGPQVGPPRTGLRPVEISQPEGVSFEVDGWQVRWQNWRMRIGWTQREGLVLHTVTYQDGDRQRPVAYRASVAELVIPYGDPRPPAAWRNAFDAGEYGLGMLVNSLELGCDCLGEVRYFDVDMVSASGEPYTVRNAICLHEEDAGLLWKHVDSATGHAEVRRSRRLVVSFIMTAGNYEYAYYWRFYLDGSIDVEVALTGIVLTTALPPGEDSQYGTVVAPQTLAANHQHFFSFRLDLDVDGPVNSVVEVNAEPAPPGPANPHGNGFIARTTLLRTERDAMRLVNPLSDRYWVVTSAGSRNALGQPCGYKLAPGANVAVFARPDSPVVRRAGYMTRHLWVTPYRADERYPAGDYPTLHPGGDGLPAWTAADRPVAGTDVVLWYTLGANHIPRPEDWPVMPVERVSFVLKPAGFFDRNPALDVPPPASGHCGSRYRGREADGET